jgi:hypothetical protein
LKEQVLIPWAIRVNILKEGQMYEKIIHIYFIYKQNWIGISIAMTFRQNGLRPILAAQENLTVLVGMKQKNNNGRLKKKLNSAHSLIEILWGFLHNKYCIFTLK